MEYLFSFEKMKLNKSKWILMWITVITQLLFLYFFTIVGHFESSEADDILKNYAALAGLATTVTMCIVTVYGTVIANRFMVKDYIGDNRIRLYLYPCGRGQLYYAKNIVFSSTFIVMQLMGMIIADALYFLGEFFFPLVSSGSPILTNWGAFITTALVGTFLTVSIIVFSSIVGIRIASSIGTIITGLILIVIMGNLVAMSFASHMLVTVVLTVLITVSVFFFMKNTESKINADEIL